jgi:hypothetical protein
MSRYIQRSTVTAALLTQLRDTGRPVGDAEMPRNGTAGWLGQPNEAGTNFIAYSVVTPLSTSAGNGPLDDPGADVWFNYSITSFGVSRLQCEDQADLMRLHALLIRKLDVVQWVDTPHEYGRRIQSVVVSSYGPIQRLGDADPKIYGQTDTVSLWTSE